MTSQEEFPDETNSSIEESVIKRLKENDYNVLSDVIMEHGNKIENILRKRFGNALTDHDIEELLSEALFILWNNRERIELSKDRFGGYFYIICRNLAIGKLKRKSREQRIFHSVPISLYAKQVSPIDEVIRNSQKVLVRKVISELNPIDRIITKAYMNSPEDDSWATELAAKLSMTANHIRVRWHRIKQLVKKRLELEEYFND